MTTWAIRSVLVAVAVSACGGHSVRREARPTGDGASGSTSTGGSAGHGAGGEGTSVPTVRPTPAPGKSWTYPPADPLNATPPILLPLGDDLVIAGATSDPELAGLDALEPGTNGVAFVARLDHEAEFQWSTPLLGAGQPASLALDSDGNLVVAAPLGTEYIGPGFGSDRTYLARLTPEGELLDAQELDFPSAPVALALGSRDERYLGGFEFGVGDSSYAVAARFDPDGTEVWRERWHNTGTVAEVRSLTVAPNGEVVLTGDFNATLTVGDESIATSARYAEFRAPNGFVVRVTPDGEPISAARFGGGELDGGVGITALADGDLLLFGYATGPTEIGGLSLQADSNGSGFLARLDGEGRARWVVFPGPGVADALAVDPDGEPFYVAGHDDGVAWLAAYSADGAEALAATLPARGLYFYTHSLAVDAAHSLWLSGGFSDSADFGNGNQLDSAGPGVFLVRLDRE